MSSEGGAVTGYMFDREAVWERVKARKAVFLDTMIWINMADDRPAARPLKARLREAVRAGKAFCPLSPLLVWELFKQEFSMFRTAELMDELSLSVSFPLTRDVFALEVELFARGLVGEAGNDTVREAVFFPAIGLVGSSFTLDYPPGWSENDIKKADGLIAGSLNSLTLLQMLQLLATEPAFLEQLRDDTPVEYQKVAQRFQGYAKGDRSKVWRVEERSVFEDYILPVVKELPIRHMLAFREYVETATPDKVGNKVCALLPHMPAIHNHIEVMFRASEDPNRKDKPNDFIDLNMMPVPLAYADVFVTEDRWMRERFLKPGEFLKRNRCQFFSNYAPLEAWLDAN